jgi:hypothetical protein
MEHSGFHNGPIKNFANISAMIKAYGLVKAMLLGRRDDLGTDQVDDYVASGDCAHSFGFRNARGDNLSGNQFFIGLD